MKRKCDGDCNNCEIINSRNSVILAQIFRAIEFEVDDITNIVSEICPNMTICPICKCDDFTHAEDCPVIN